MNDNGDAEFGKMLYVTQPNFTIYGTDVIFDGKAVWLANDVDNQHAFI